MQSRLLDNLKLRHVTCFLAVARHRHIGRAADELHLTQPAVSKTLSELDNLVGARLFDRGRHGATLTGAGEQFLRHALEVSDALTQLDVSAQQLAGGITPRATLRVGALPTVATGILPGTLAEFRRIHPDTDVVVVTDTNAALCQALLNGDHHCVVGRIPDPQVVGSRGGLTFELLYAESLALAVRTGHPLAGNRDVAMAGVVTHPMIVSPAATVPRAHAEALFRSHGVEMPHGRLETLSVSVARQVTLDSDAVWVIPERTIADDVARGILTRLPISSAGTEEPVGVLRAVGQDPEPAVEDFLRLLRAHVG
ncbi:LysR substrate-binding domain-containing protein [Gordonia sp. CPCC 205515]|uniref:LysR substrate-binding domain-containing protein n=1 Tax=Gordonia sp. CPCC 205515 TaxID=3140791 RepID=UPI003AF3B533